MAGLLEFGAEGDCTGPEEFGTSCAGEVLPQRSQSGASTSWRCGLHRTEYAELSHARAERGFWQRFYAEDAS